MEDGYYPKYYQKKKQRDSVYLNICWVVIILGIGIPLGFILFTFFPVSRTPSGAAELAEQKEELEAAKVIDEASQAQASPAGGQDPNPPSKSANLAEIKYVGSQPSVHVEIQGVTPDESRDPHMIDDEPGASNQEEVRPSNETVANASNPDSGQTDSDRLARGNPESENNSAERAETTNQGDSGSREETPATIPDPDPDPEPEPEERPEDPPKEVAKPKGITVWKVFAGSYYTRDEAVSRKKDLSTLGFGGSVQDWGGIFSIFVSEFEDGDKAKALVTKLKENGFPDALVARTKT